MQTKGNTNISRNDSNDTCRHVYYLSAESTRPWDHWLDKGLSASKWPAPLDSPLTRMLTALGNPLGTAAESHFSKSHFSALELRELYMHGRVGGWSRRRTRTCMSAHYSSADRFQRAMSKHAAEIRKMGDPGHRHMILVRNPFAALRLF